MAVLHTASPQYLSRGNFFFSSRRHFQPSFAEKYKQISSEKPDPLEARKTTLKENNIADLVWLSLLMTGLCFVLS